MAIKIGDLFWKIKGDTADVDKKLKDTNTEVDGSATKFSKLQGIVAKAAPWIAAGAAAVAVGKKIFQLGVDAGNAADKLLDLTEITGLNTDTLQELQFIAADAGVNFDGLTGAVQRFTTKIPQLEKTGDVADAFNALGVNLRDANGEIRDADDLFPDLIKSLQNIENTTERNSIASQLFGRSLNDLAPILGLTNDEFDDLRDKAESAGAIIGGDALTAANDFRKEFDAAKLAVNQAKIALGSEFAPVLSEVVIPIVTTAANIINTLAKAIGSLNDLLNEPNDRPDQIAREIDFLNREIDRVSTLTMISQDQRDVLTANYETRIIQLNAELRGLALQAEAEKIKTEEIENQTDAIDENTEATEEQGEAIEDTAQFYAVYKDEIDDLVRANDELHKSISITKDETEDLEQSFIDLQAIQSQALTSMLSGFEELGQTIVSGGDAFAVFGKIALESLAEVLRALGAQLAAQAAVLAFGLIPDIPRAIGAAAASAAAFTAAGVVGGVASTIDTSPTPAPTATVAGTETTSGSAGGTSRGGSGSSYNITINNLISTGKESELREAVRAQAPYMVEELVRRGDL